MFYNIFAVATPLTLVWGFANTIPLYVTTAINEKLSQTKHLLKVSGVKVINYWTGLILADYLIFLLSSVVLIGSILAIEPQTFT
jgi:hypothetical protein